MDAKNYKLNWKKAQSAAKASLAGYLRSRGEPLYQDGHLWRHREMPGLIVTDDVYYWAEHQSYGSAIDYLCKELRIPYQEAVDELAAFAGKAGGARLGGKSGLDVGVFRVIYHGWKLGLLTKSEIRQLFGDSAAVADGALIFGEAEHGKRAKKL
jgi:hypothetical protein